MAADRQLAFLLPGDWHTPTGGYQYDRRIAQALVEDGWQVAPLHADGAWPQPEAATLAQAAALVDALPDGRRVLADGLAYGVLDTLVARHARRLRWVALVHHPLHLEAGLPAARRAALQASEARALQHARQVVVTSAHTAQDVAALGVPAGRIAVVEPGTDPAPAAAASPPVAPVATDGAPAPVQLLCVATLTPRKGHDLLLQALAGLAALPWQLHCVGSLQRDPATARQLQAAAQAAGLGARVAWHGEIDAAQLQTHYAAADLLVLPSRHEGYGMVVAEALAAGLPVLASDAGALAQTLPPQAGWHVPAGDAAALQAALQRLITDPALRARLAAGARAAGRQLPGWPAQARRLAAVLDALP